MAVLIRCPECNKKLHVPSKLLGTESTCPKCEKRITIPGQGEPVTSVSTVDVKTGEPLRKNFPKAQTTGNTMSQVESTKGSSGATIFAVVVVTMLFSIGLVYLGMRISQWSRANGEPVAVKIEDAGENTTSGAGNSSADSDSTLDSDRESAGAPEQSKLNFPPTDNDPVDNEVQNDDPNVSNPDDSELELVDSQDQPLDEDLPTAPESHDSQVTQDEPDPAVPDDNADEANEDPPNEVVADNDTESDDLGDEDPVDLFPKVEADDKSRNAIVQRAKNATAYVITPRSTGTAFCIDSSGLFVTNAHVVNDVRKNEKIRLVLNTDSSRPIRLFAKVEEIETDSDLALLSVSRSGPFPTLEIGNSDGLFETTEIIAFGYPFGGDLTMRGDDYPSISVNVGRVTALRKKGKKLKLIQLDAEVNPGNSGGPVIDLRGKVIGVVTAMLRDGAGINFAIPVEEIGTHLLDKPVVTFQIPQEVKAADLAKPITATLTISNRSGKPLKNCEASVDVDATGETIKFTQRDQNVYVAKFNLVRMANYKDVLFDAYFDTNKISGKLVDQEITLEGDKSLKLRIRDIASLSKTGDNATEFELKKTNGTRFKCKLPAKLWKSVGVKLAGQDIDVNLQDANRIEFRGAEFPDTIKLDASFAVEDEEIWKERFTIVVDQESNGKDDVVRRKARKRPQVVNVELTKPKAISLPDNIDDVCFGADGRLMFVSLPLIRQIAVIDMAQKKVTTYLAAPEGQFFMAAGRDRLVVAETEKNILRSYDIYDFESVVSKRIDMDGTVMGLGMGSASKGPLLVAGVRDRMGEIAFFDPDRLKPLELKRIGSDNHRIRTSSNTRIRASANGLLFTITSGSSSAEVLRMRGTRYEVLSVRDSLGLAIPSPDGRDIYTSRGLVSTSQLSTSSPRQTDHRTYVPALHGDLYFKLSDIGGYRSGPKPKVWLHQRGASESLGLVESATNAFANKEIQSSSTNYQFSLEKKLVLAPKFKVLAIVRESIIDLYPFNLKDIIATDGVDYLTVVSTPPTSANINDTFEYAIKVESSAGKVDYRLDVKPSGMTVSKDGVVEWRPKPFHRGQPNQVVVRITAGDDLEIHHSFGVTVN